MREFHGMSKTSEYTSWCAARERCNNPKNKAFRHYGGRGIVFSPKWDSFTAFYADMGPKPSPNHSLDRIDANGNYEPGNCRWATKIEQMNNKRTNVLGPSMDGTRMVTQAQWLREMKCPEYAELRKECLYIENAAAKIGL